jgi:hypothetical protein
MKRWPSIWLGLVSVMDILSHGSLIRRFFPIDPDIKWDELLEQSNGINVGITDLMRTQKRPYLGAALYRSRNETSTRRYVMIKLLRFWV